VTGAGAGWGRGVAGPGVQIRRSCRRSSWGRCKCRWGGGVGGAVAEGGITSDNISISLHFT
jgi:hypothetical protein